MKTRKTIYHLIVDKSGSMTDCVDSTINGFNEQVNRIKDKAKEFTEEDITMGLTTFNDNVKHVYFQQNPKEMVLLNYENYRPSGGTALLDAVGETITEIEQQVNTSLMPTTVIVVILTDGYENASKKYNLVNIRNMISKLEETGKWTFSFIGATLDAVDVASSMAIKSQNSFSFEKTQMKSAVWDKLDKSVSSYFTKKSQNRNLNNFFED
jgi:uncharacterized protein YegL